MKFRNLSLFVLLMVAAVACSGSDAASPNTASSNTDSADVSVADDAGNDDTENDDAATDVVAEAPTEPNVETPAEGAAATVTIGDQTWTFDATTCTLGTEVDGEIFGPSVAGGFTADATMGMVVSSDGDFGDRVTVNDFAFDEVSARYDSSIEFTEVIFDGDSFSGTGEFIDKASDSLDRIPGTFSGTCP